MVITICGSMKFNNEMINVKEQLEALSHLVFIPTKVEGVDYWAENNTHKVAAKKKYNLIDEHMTKIEQSDAILVVNITKNKIKNYIGANTFLEMGFAHYHKKKIFTLNQLPNQTYILDEMLAMSPIVLNGKFNKLA